MVLKGTWELKETTLTLEAQEGFWKSIFSSPSVIDERPVPSISEDWSIVEPVTQEEVAKALRDPEDSAPEPDGVTFGAMNPAKCATLRIDIDGSAKRWVVYPSSFLTINDKDVKSLDVMQTYKYLGLQAGPCGMRKAHGDVLRVGLGRLTRAL